MDWIIRKEYVQKVNVARQMHEVTKNNKIKNTNTQENGGPLFCLLIAPSLQQNKKGTNSSGS